MRVVANCNVPVAIVAETKRPATDQLVSPDGLDEVVENSALEIEARGPVLPVLTAPVQEVPV